MSNNKSGTTPQNPVTTLGLDILDDYLLDVSLDGVHGNPDSSGYSARISLRLPEASDRWLLDADTHDESSPDYPAQNHAAEIHVTIWQGWPVCLRNQDPLAIMHEFAVCAYDWTENGTDGWTSMLARDLAAIAAGRARTGQLIPEAQSLLDRFRARVPPRFSLPPRCFAPSRDIPPLESSLIR